MKIIRLTLAVDLSFTSYIFRESQEQRVKKRSLMLSITSYIGQVTAKLRPQRGKRHHSKTADQTLKNTQTHAPLYIR